MSKDMCPYPGDEVMARAAELCKDHCRALICERDNICFGSKAWSGPGFGWFEQYINAAKKEIVTPKEDIP